MWVTTTDLPMAASHPFYRRLNQLLREHGFDDFVEAQCASFYASTPPRWAAPACPRDLFPTAADWLLRRHRLRARDRLACGRLVGFAGFPGAGSTRRAVFTWVAQCLGHTGLIKGKTIGLDATTLEANAALRSIVRRDTGEGYEEFLARLAKASGIGTPTRADLARLDRKRKKKGSNDDWTHPHDPDAKITKMKDGRTHLAH